VERLGGIPEKCLAETKVLIYTEENNLIEGVIGTKAHHLTPQEEKYKVVPVREVYIDIGVETREKILQLGIKIGNPIVYFRTFNNNKIFANAIDNRVGCAILMKTLDELVEDNLKLEIFFVWSVQEEFNLKGVISVIEEIRPNIAICVDCSISSDTPDLKGYSDISLGEGPTLNLYSFHSRGELSGLIPTKGFVKHVSDVALKNNLNIKRNIIFGGLSDASYLPIKGVPSIDLSFPIRYCHAPVEVCDIRDLNNIKEWLKLILYSLTPPHNTQFIQRGTKTNSLRFSVAL